MTVRCPLCSTLIQLGGHAGYTPSPQPSSPYPPKPHAHSAVPSVANTASGGQAEQIPASSDLLTQERVARASRNRDKSNSLAIPLAMTTAVLLVMGGLVGLVIALSSQKPSPNEVATDTATRASQQARQLLAKRLQLPATALFASGGDRVRLRSAGQWEVTSYVDVPSRVEGVVLRQQWVALVSEGQRGEWQLARLVVDGQTVEPSYRGTSDGSRAGWPTSSRRDSESDSSTSAAGRRFDQMTTHKAMDRVASDIRESVALRKTLVVWVVDRSPSARPQLEEVVRLIEPLYREMQPGTAAGGNSGAADGAKLAMAVVAFGSDVTFPLEQPATRAEEVQRAFQSLDEDRSGREVTFAAIIQAVEKYHGFRVQQGGYVQLVVVSDEVGDDQDRLEEALALVQQHAVVVQTIGVPAPFGRLVGPEQKSLEAAGQVQQGPESMLLERIDLAFPGSGYSSGPDTFASGFGPFSLTRLCQQSGGGYFVCHDFGIAAGSRTIRSDWSGRQSARAEFNLAIMRRYAPDYVSGQEYRQLLASNSACQALHAAARLPHRDVLGAVTLDFPKRDEATFKRDLDAAQRDAAKYEPRLLELYNVLKPGERDRDKLTRPRWQAGFDLAMGRILAARVRTEGYNAMLANIKTNSVFKDESSTTWVLEPADEISGAGSVYQKMLEDARRYLERVVKDHPGTPWALLAQRELETPIGWKWSER